MTRVQRIEVTAFALVLFGLFVWADNIPALTGFGLTRLGAFSTVVGLSYWALAATSLSAALLSDSRILRHGVYQLLIASLTVNAAAASLSSTGLGIEEARIMLHEAGFAWHALISFLPLYGPAVAIALLLGGALYTAGVRRMPPIIPAAWAMAAMAFVLICGTFTLGLAGLTWLPVPFRVPAVIIANASPPEHAPQRVVNVPSNRGIARHIVVLVDESVRGDHLSINGYPRPTTPRLERSQGVISFGVASSATNCSASANLMLRSPAPTAREALESPDVFDYARAAGRRVVLIDGQSGDARPRNFISSADLALVDEHIVISTLFDGNPPRWKMDVEILAQLRRLLAEPQPSLIWVNKWGAHFHYAAAHPPGASPFRPQLGRLEPMRDLEKTRNSYDNALRWTVDEFGGGLLDVLTDRDAIVLWTSDHGQSFSNEGSAYPHCVSRNPPPGQGRVPIMVVTRRTGPEIEQLAESARRRRGTLSHREVAPTLLSWMGFRTPLPTIQSGSPSARVFMSGDPMRKGYWEENPVDAERTATTSRLTRRR